MRKTKRFPDVAPANLIARRLTELFLGGVDEVPDGYYSAEQLAKISGRSRKAIQLKMAKLKVDKKLLRVKRGTAVKRMAFYRV